MTKGKKSKVQKKKFFGDPRNLGKVFKRKEMPVDDQKSKELRKRGNYVLLPTEGIKEIPHCAHGPCLLIGTRENDVVTSRFFTCAIYRHDLEKCAYKGVLDSEGNILPQVKPEPVEGEETTTTTPTKPSKKEVDDDKKKPKWGYNTLTKKLQGMAADSNVVWCTECYDIFEHKHNHPAQFVDRALLTTPSRLMEPLEAQLGEAQYFFSDEALGVITRTIDSIEVDSILCIGAPRLFETLKNENEKADRKLFLLDYDKRYAPYYKSTEYAQYSMLTNHLYDPKSLPKLTSFLSNATRLLIVCDPPFGVFVEPLMQSIEKLKKIFVEASSEQSPQCYGMIILPMFVGKRAVYFDNTYYMHDYRVTYANHKTFAKQKKTTVRIFTNIAQEKIVLEGVEGYKFCEFCEYWVHNDNKHCFMCMKCTSKDGSAYRHCERCMRCNKLSYRHCLKCERCHIPGRCMTKEQLESGGDEGEMDQEREEGDEE